MRLNLQIAKPNKHNNLERKTMRSNKKKIPLLISLTTVVSLLLSCSVVPKELRPLQVVVQPEPESVRQNQSASVAQRFQESAPESPTVVESAMELTKEYTKLSEEAVALRQQNQNLVVRNKQLEDQIVDLQGQLKQTQKELSEANTLLITMRIELNSWKTDVIGFRDEMRSAETAQLEALFKILQVLGGEVETNSAQIEQVGPRIASLNKPNRSER